MVPELKRLLRREASSHHMCEENRLALDSVETKAEAISLYKKTIDWALEEGYPSIPTLRRYFSDCEEYGIFVDKIFHGELLDEHQVYVFHNCRGQIRTGLNLQKQIIPMLYFANGCEMSVVGSGESVRVPLYVFGTNDILAEKGDGLEFKFYTFDVK